MRATISNLFAHRDSLNKLPEEMNETDRTTGLTRSYPKWIEVKDLPFLDASVQEAVHLHPPFSPPLESVAPRGRIVIKERYFPEGTCIGVNPCVVNRHRPSFGEGAVGICGDQRDS